MMKLGIVKVYQLDNERGFVLVTSLVLMIMLGVLGVAANNIGMMEVRIAGNEKHYKKAFYAADSGAELVVGLLEQNLACGQGLSEYEEEAVDGERIIGLAGDNNLNVLVTTTDFWLNERAEIVYLPLEEEEMDDLPREPAQQEIPDFIIPANWNPQSGGPHTLVTVAGEIHLASGGAMQMATGYSGVGRGAGSHGSYMVYDITSRHIGLGAGEAVVHQQWRHIVGMETECD